MNMHDDDEQCRHLITAFPGDYHGQIGYVGWDRPLNTFFLQIGPPEDDNLSEIDSERMAVWVGTSWGEIPTLEALFETAELSWKLPDHIDFDLCDHLEQTQQVRLGRKPHLGFEL